MDQGQPSSSTVAPQQLGVQVYCLWSEANEHPSWLVTANATKLKPKRVPGIFGHWACLIFRKHVMGVLTKQPNGKISLVTKHPLIYWTANASHQPKPFLVVLLPLQGFPPLSSCFPGKTQSCNLYFVRMLNRHTVIYKGDLRSWCFALQHDRFERQGEDDSERDPLVPCYLLFLLACNCLQNPQ